jgi:putative endonuclease
MNWPSQMKINWLERTLAGLDRMAQRRGNAERIPAHLVVGTEGEDAAFFYLRRKRYTVVARRWSAGERPGDIDLIAWQGSTLCFIEVKTRTARDASPAEVAVDSHKRNVLRRLAHVYLRQLEQQTLPPVRFDVISVYMVAGQEKEFAHFEGSFGWSDWEGRE